MKSRYLIFSLLLLTLPALGQEKSEKNIFSFKSEEGSSLAVSMDTITNLLICRHTVPDAAEIAVIDDLDDDIPVFEYSCYFRGGGTSNSGLDLNYLTFRNGTFQYTVYQEYSAEDDNTSVGVRIVDSLTRSQMEVVGLVETIAGNLSDFRYNELVPVHNQ